MLRRSRTRAATILLGLTLSAPLAAADVILDETAFFRHYNRFGVNRYSPALLKNDGVKILTKVGFDRLQRDTQRYLQQRGEDPARLDWMENAYQPTWANFAPPLDPAPPGDWAGEKFDDSNWVLRRRPFQGSKPTDITMLMLGQYDENTDLGVQHVYYRTRLVVDGAANRRPHPQRPVPRRHRRVPQR